MKRKFACFGLAFAGLELFAAYLPPLVSLLAAAVLGLALVLLRRKPVRVLLLGALCGLAYFGLFSALFVAPAQNLAGRTATCVAVVDTDCAPSYAEGRLYGTLHITAVDGKPCSLYAYCSSFPGTEPGEEFTAKLSFAKLEQNRYRLSRLARGVRLQAEYVGDYAVQGRSSAPLYTLYRLRETLYARLSVWLPRDLAGMMAAMLLGDKSRLPDTTADAFRVAGVSHLLAVSGLHVALLCGLLFAGHRRKFYRPMIAVQALVVLFYMLLTGLPVSVLRAGLVFLLALLGNWFLQPHDLLTATGAAAFLMGLQNAYAPCDIGFQLSFAAVLGVQAAAAMTRWERKRLYTPEPKTVRQRTGNAALQLLSALQTAALASLATTPVLIAHGLTTSGVGVLTNLLVVWMLRPALQLGMLVLLLGLLPPLGAVIHMVSLLLAAWLSAMLAIVNWCASLPAARLYLPPKPTLLTLALLGALALVFWHRRRFLWYWPVATGVTVAAVCLVVLLEQDVTRVALVGTAGNPCAVATQNGRAVIFYRGGAGNLRAVQDYLAEHGDPAPELVVDLRQKPAEIALQAEETLFLQEMNRLTTVPVLEGATLELYHRSSGNLAVLDTGSCRVGLMAGNIELPEPIAVDVFCAAGALSDSVLAETIVYTATNPKWLTNEPQAALLQGQENPTIIIRPDKNATFEEVRQIAVQ